MIKNLHIIIAMIMATNLFMGCGFGSQKKSNDQSDETKTMTTHDVFHYNGEIVWLEDREAVIKAEQKLKNHSILKTSIQIAEKKIEIIASFDVLNDPKNIYFISYKDISENDRNLILDYIFKSYRE